MNHEELYTKPLTFLEAAQLVALGPHADPIDKANIVESVHFHRWPETHDVTCLIKTTRGTSVTANVCPENGVFDEKLALRRSFEIALGQAAVSWVGMLTRQLSNVPYYHG